MRRDGERSSRRRRNADAYVFAILVFVSFSGLLLSMQSFVFDFRDFGLSFFSGIRGGVHAVTGLVTRTVLSIKELSELKKEYAELTSRMERYAALERDSAEIRRENLRLREQLGFAQTIQYRHISASIIGRDPDNLYSAFVIDKGIKNGIERDMPVIAYQDGVQGLVGKIVQVGRSESLVMPVFDSSSFVSARFSESRYDGIVSGQGGSDIPLIMRYIKKRAKDDIRFGDVIETSGLGGIFPRNLIVGRVSKVIFQEYETSLEVEIEPAIDFSRLEYVFAVDKEEEVIQDD